MEPVFRLYIDEVGHSNMKATNHPNEQYLSLTGVIMSIAYERGKFNTLLNEIKQEIFGTQNIVLHRTEMVYRRPPFDCLTDDTKRARLDDHIIQLIAESTYRVITVVIDKADHKSKYLAWQAHPYHYCLMTMLERYVLWLHKADSVGDVMAESRGRKTTEGCQNHTNGFSSEEPSTFRPAYFRNG